MTWMYEDSPFIELPLGTFGFIYQIDYAPDEEHPNGSSYVGKRQCLSEVRLPALKNGTTRPEASYRIGRNINGKRVQFDVVHKESTWKKYTGSSDLTKGKTILRKTVLALCTSKRELTYYECKALFCLNAIEDDQYLNVNILGKFYRGNLS